MKHQSILSTLICSAALLISTSAAQAAPNVCKGVQQAACADAGSCRWVNSYKRSDGREINGYCRKLPTKDSKEASTTKESKQASSQAS